MTQVIASNTNNTVKVYSVGLQGSPGPSGSLQSSNSGSFSITGSLIVSGSNTFTNIGPAIFSGSVTSTNGFTGSLVGTATTASYISPTFISASAAASGFGGGGSTNTGSLMVTGSVTGSVLTFIKGDGSTFNLTVDTGSGGGGSTNTGSLMVTGSVSSATLTFTKGDNSTFPLTINNVSNATSASYALNATSASFSSTATSASFSTTASFALNAGTTVSTASLLTTGSATNNVLTFTKGDGSTFNLTVDTGSAVTTPTSSLMVTGSVSSNTLTFTKGDGSTFNLTVNTGSGGGGSAFPFSGSAVITGSLVISGSTTMGTGDTRGLQIFNNGPANLSVRSNTGGTSIAFDGQTTQMYLSSNNSLGGTQISNMFFNTTFSGMGDGSGLGFINFAQGSGTSNDSFGSIRTYLKGVNKSEVRIYSQIVGVGVTPDISFISGSLIDVNRKIETDQDIEITDSSKGIILKSPNGTRYRITINDSGILVSGSI
jgi:hypothetical protein